MERNMLSQMCCVLMLSHTHAKCLIGFFASHLFGISIFPRIRASFASRKCSNTKFRFLNEDQRQFSLRLFCAMKFSEISFRFYLNLKYDSKLCLNLNSVWTSNLIQFIFEWTLNVDFNENSNLERDFNLNLILTGFFGPFNFNFDLDLSLNSNPSM